MITTNSNGVAFSSAFLSAVAENIVTFDMALMLNGERLPGAMGRMTLMLGSADDSGDSSSDIAIGGVFSAQLEGQLIDCTTSVIDKELEVRIGVDVGGGVFEYTTVAFVTVIWSRKAGEITSIQAVGRIAAKMTGVTLGLSTGYVNASTLAQRIATRTGVNVTLGAFNTTSQQVHVDAGWTCRRALQALALSLGGFAAEIGGGVMVAPMPSAYTYTLSGDITRTVPQLADDVFVIDGLTVSTGGDSDEQSTATQYVYGTGKLVITDEFATQATANALWQNINGVTYMAGSVETSVLDPRLTPFDMVRITDEYGDTYNLPSTNITATYDGGYYGTLSANAPSDSADAAVESGPMMAAVGEARNAAQVAQAAIAETNQLLDGVKELAEEADKTVAEILEDAEQAGTASQEARNYATRALTASRTAEYGLSEIEKVVGTITWIAEHGTYELTTDTAVDENKIYYRRKIKFVPTADDHVDSSKTYYRREGTDEESYEYWVVQNPVDADIATYFEETYTYEIVIDPQDSEIASYYELAMDESVQNYLSTHLALTDEGLSVFAGGSFYKMLIATDAIHVIDSTGVVIASYGRSSTVGPLSDFHLSTTGSSMEFWQGDTLVSYINNNQMKIPSVVVDERMEVGDWAWIHRANGHLSLVWIGVD